MCNAECHDLHSPSNNTSKMRLAGTAVLMGDGRNTQVFWWENMKEKSHLADLGIDTS